MTTYSTSNMFKVLADDEEDVYEEFEHLKPYNLVIDNKWWMLSPSPVAQLIKERFSCWYIGKLTQREINAIKEEMDRAENDLDTYRDKIYDNKCELVKSLKEQKRLCKENSECEKKLDAHISVCDGIDGAGKYKCEKNYISYDCQFKENGRCSHHYQIERIEERLDEYQYTTGEYNSKYLELLVLYERALAVKENRLEEYEQQIEDEYDDWNFEFGQRMM